VPGPVPFVTVSTFRKVAGPAAGGQQGLTGGAGVYTLSR
jgi:hypothetical protein